MTDVLKISTDNRQVVTVTMNRPEKHNAFDDILIKTLTALLKQIKHEPPRALILTGAGDTFSSGADLNWMQDTINYSKQTNIRDAENLANLMRILYDTPCPTIAKVNGPGFGGALGLIACCDIAIAANHAHFGFTEVKIGLVPAVISPYIVHAIGQRQARRLFVTGELFSAERAKQIGLLHEVVATHELDESTEKIVRSILKGGPIAQEMCKGLLNDIAPIDEGIFMATAELIASLRTSKEGQEGLKAFLEKRKPNWYVAD